MLYTLLLCDKLQVVKCKNGKDTTLVEWILLLDSVMLKYVIIDTGETTHIAEEEVEMISQATIRFNLQLWEDTTLVLW